MRKFFGKMVLKLFPEFGTPLKVGGVFTMTCKDKDGNFKWKEVFKNGVTTLGLNHLLDVTFHGSTQKTTWYIGLIRDDNYSALAAADTLASHAGWEEGDEYTGDRKEWTEGAAAAGVMTNAATVDFTMDDTETMKGAFLCAAATGTAEVLFCTALFTGGDQAVAAADVLQVTYELTAS